MASSGHPGRGPDAAGASEPAQTAYGQQAQSKRDRKRQLVLEKLKELEDKHKADADPQYRDAIRLLHDQATLMFRVDPFAKDPLAHITTNRDALFAKFAPLADLQARISAPVPTFEEWITSLEDSFEARDNEIAYTNVCTPCPLSLPCASEARPASCVLTCGNPARLHVVR